MTSRTLLLALALFATACGDSGPAEKPAEKPAAEKKAEKPAEKKAEKPAAKPAAAATGPLKPGEDGIVHLEANDMMKFSADRIEVEGTKVKVELKHVGKLAKSAMGHNFVVLKPGTDPAGWASKTISAAATEYIPEGDEAMIAHTKLLGGGESDTIEFEVPGPGEYPFVCSFPGHAAMMKGVLVVK